MNRFTISIDDQLAHQFDILIADKGYANRSEAVRDLIHYGLGRASMAQISAGAEEAHCIASVTIVYDRGDPSISARVANMMQRHHELVVNTQHTPLNARECLETVTLKGSAIRIGSCADHLTTIRGVRHGNVHVVPLTQSAASGVDQGQIAQTGPEVESRLPSQMGALTA